MPSVLPQQKQKAGGKQGPWRWVLLASPAGRWQSDTAESPRASEATTEAAALGRRDGRQGVWGRWDRTSGGRVTRETAGAGPGLQDGCSGTQSEFRASP